MTVPKADPKRPYKMYAAVATAVIGSLLTAELPTVLRVVLMATLAGLAVFITPNPIKRVHRRDNEKPPAARGY